MCPGGCTQLLSHFLPVRIRSIYNYYNPTSTCTHPTRNPTPVVEHLASGSKAIASNSRRPAAGGAGLQHPAGLALRPEHQDPPGVRWLEHGNDPGSPGGNQGRHPRMKGVPQSRHGHPAVVVTPGISALSDRCETPPADISDAHLRLCLVIPSCGIQIARRSSLTWSLETSFCRAWKEIEECSTFSQSTCH